MDGSQVKRLKEIETKKKKLQQQRERVKRRALRIKPKTKIQKGPSRGESIAAAHVKEGSSNFHIYVIIVLFVTSVLFAASGPPLALTNISSAAYKNDTAKLEENIDFPQLKRNIKQQVKEQVLDIMDQELSGNIFTEFAKYLANSVTDIAVDEFISPESIGNLLRANKNRIDEPSFFYFVKEIKYNFHSPSVVIATIIRGDDKGTEMSLERQGFSWKLVNITIPDDIEIQDVKRLAAAQLPDTTSTPVKTIDPTPLVIPDEVPEEIKRQCFEKWGDKSQEANECTNRNLSLRTQQIATEMKLREKELKTKLYKKLEKAETVCKKNYRPGTSNYRYCMSGVEDERARLYKKYN